MPDVYYPEFEIWRYVEQALQIDNIDCSRINYVWYGKNNIKPFVLMSSAIFYPEFELWPLVKQALLFFTQKLSVLVATEWIMYVIMQWK